MIRQAKIAPGFDCIYAECKHEPKGNHGIYPDEWCFIVGDGESWLVLVVMTASYPATIPVSHWLRHGTGSDCYPAHGIAFYEHRPVDYSGGSDGHGGCALVKPKCYGGAWYTAARDFWTRLGDNAAIDVQTEDFWLALESLYTTRVREPLAKYRADQARLDVEFAL
jgi:hypothetical protein